MAASSDLAFVHPTKRLHIYDSSGTVLHLLLPFTIEVKKVIHEADFFDSRHSLCEYSQPTLLLKKEPAYEYQQN